LSDERDHPFLIDGHDGNCAGMLDDLAFVLTPLFDGDVEQLAVVDRS
jgi:hypothetical protein